MQVCKVKPVDWHKNLRYREHYQNSSLAFQYFHTFAKKIIFYQNG